MSDRDALVVRTLRGARPSGDGWMRANCPFCESRIGKADRKASFGAHTSTGWWHCFRCGARGKADLAVMPAPPETEDGPRELEMPSSYLPLWEGPGGDAIVTREARFYLVGRGIGPSLWKLARIGAAVDGRHFGRVIVPMLADGRWVGWVGRAWTRRAEMPYLYPRGMERAGLLYNREALLRETGDPVAVVEGVFDTFPLLPDAVAVLGKPSHLQVAALAEARRPVAVVLDGDAWMEGWSLAMQLRLAGRRAGAVRLPPRTDPDEVDVGWLREEMRRCLDA